MGDQPGIAGVSGPFPCTRGAQFRVTTQSLWSAALITDCKRKHNRAFQSDRTSKVEAGGPERPMGP